MGSLHPEPAHQLEVPLELRLLGGFELRDARGGAIALSTRKTEALLALLALQPGEPIARDKLCGLLWPDVPDTQARHSLRQTLSQLRKALRDDDGAALRADTRTLTLDTSQLRVDVASLREHLETGSREALAVAAQLYRGDLLDGLFLNEQPFEHWLTVAREQLRAAMVAGFERLVDACEKAGEEAHAVQASVRLLELDPWRESAHRSLMLLHVRHGRRAAALAHYQALTRKLQLELGSEPETATQRLYAELQAPASAHRAQPRAAPSLFSIGRDSELAMLRQRQHEAGLTLLLGEAGVGKTHVCELLAVSLAATGRRVLRGRCFESEQVLPFALWETLLASAQLQLPEQPQHAAPDPLRMFRGAQALLSGLNEKAPLLLVLDDLHWADEMSLRLLCFLTRQPPSAAGCFIVGTARAEELYRATFMREALAELDREMLLTRQNLAPLSREDSGELARHVTEHVPLAAAWLEQIWTLSEGNPLVIQEAARALVDGGVPQEVVRLPVPERVRALIRRRLSRIAPPAREVLAFAAIAGRDVDLGLLQHETPDPAQLWAAVEELTEAQLMCSTGERLFIAHDRIRETLYDELLPARRRWLHGRVAAALLASCGGNPDAVLGQLGHHYFKSGEAQPAVEYLVRFSERAWRDHGVNESLAALERAFEASLQLPASHRPARTVEILVRQALCLAFLGRFNDIVARLSEYEAELGRLASDELAGPFHFWIGFALTLLGEPTNAEQRVERALAHARACGHQRMIAFALALLCHCRALTGHCREGTRHGEAATELLSNSDVVPEAISIAWLSLTHSQLHSGDWKAALRSAERASEIAKGADSRRATSLAATGLGLVYAFTQQWELALQHARRALEASDSPFTFVLAAYVLAWAQVGKRDPQAAIMLLEPIDSQLELYGMRGWSAHAKNKLSEAVLAAGDRQRAHSLASAALEIARTTGDIAATATALLLCGRAACALGDLTQARALLNESLATYRSYDARIDVANAHLAFAELEYTAGDLPAAKQALVDARALYGALEVKAGATRATKLLAKP